MRSEIVSYCGVDVRKRSVRDYDDDQDDEENDDDNIREGQRGSGGGDTAVAATSKAPLSQRGSLSFLCFNNDSCLVCTDLAATTAGGEGGRRRGGRQ